jgi:hypothetical protein
MKSINQKTIIYAYRQTYDTGIAPCFFDLNGNRTNKLTLVLCKGGQIRKGKPVCWGMRHAIGRDHRKQIESGETKVYIAGVYRKKLLYIAEITKIITMTEYFFADSEYKNRFDSIYDTLPDGFEHNGKNPCYHSMGEIDDNDKRNWHGKYALISDCFAYFGKSAIDLSSDLLDTLPRGYKLYDNDSHGKQEIIDRVHKRWNFKDIIAPSSKEELQGPWSGSCSASACHKPKGC